MSLILRGERQGGEKTDSAWLVFQEGYAGEPVWLPKRGPRVPCDRLISRPRPNQVIA
jgi:hypothetical protein